MPHKRWKSDEDLRLRSLIEEGRPWLYIAEKLNRTPAAVAEHARKLGKAKGK
jgi:Myb-like DNA-binding protein